MKTQTSLRTKIITPNENISFSIGTILTVQKYYERLGLCGIFGKHKKRGRDINTHLTVTVEYKKSGEKRHIF
jgi:transposase